MQTESPENSPDILVSGILLRKYKEDEREIFADFFLDKEVNHYMGGKVDTRQEAYDLFEKVFSIYRGELQPRRFELWAIEIDGGFAGHFELKQTDMTDKDELEIVYMLKKEHWGKGIMKDVINEIRRYSANSGHRLIATASPENIRSMRLLKKCGIESSERYEHEEGEGVKIRLSGCSDSS